jgi:hypothetical protein
MAFVPDLLDKNADIVNDLASALNKRHQDSTRVLFAAAAVVLGITLPWEGLASRAAPGAVSSEMAGLAILLLSVAFPHWPVVSTSLFAVAIHAGSWGGESARVERCFEPSRVAVWVLWWGMCQTHGIAWFGQK